VAGGLGGEDLLVTALPTVVDQPGPGFDRRGFGQRGEVDDDALAAPATCQGHDPDGVQALADQVATRLDCIDVHAEKFGHLRPDVLRARRGVHHRPSLISTGCPNFLVTLSLLRASPLPAPFEAPR